MLLAGALMGWPGTAGAAVAHVRVTGGVSYGATLAVGQFAADVQRQGMQVDVYPSGGLSAGWAFSGYETDFAVTRRQLDFRSDSRPYAYVPLFGGGTALPYRLTIGDHQVRDLRLSGSTIARIFTNQITDWSDPAITADNNGRRFPPLPIIPVVHADNTDESVQLSAYLADRFPQIWGPFNNGSATATGNFPQQGAAVALWPGQLRDFLSQAANNGAIAYDGYASALEANLPVAKVRNEAGYFTLPTDFNVSVALQRARFDTDPGSASHLMQRLEDVYTNPDRRAYPLSSYTYAVLPTGTVPYDRQTTTQQRQTLADFVDHAICRGQASLGVQGYAPLPTNLVQAGYAQLRRLAAADPAVSVPVGHPERCGNPAYSAAGPDVNRLVEVGPMPSRCDQDGSGPCLVGPFPPPAVPLSIGNDTEPYPGAASLRVAGGTAVHLTQVDPASAAGHPAQATDPTGHRHAWVFAGSLGGVAVDDSRPGMPGWTLVGQATDFVNGATAVPARNLGWTPALVGPGSDAEGSPTAGPPVTPALGQASSTGLAEPGTVLAAAPPGSGLGVQRVAADLALWMPDTSAKGTYTATLTLTLISA
ncbi:hypothetical protein GCM10010532_007800 [Dactylosporangium siamense]|uniref:PBP domain-containing protein n=1 Tax=Dactylosporangium siamense TaxID=685454 RepID=A0A919PG67_9ACTN|nr:hypothetical protein Dsi01nite_006920 [Dactylosporangium siamense]